MAGLRSGGALVGLAALLLSGSLAREAGAGDFNPEGRKRRPAASQRNPGPAPAPPRSGAPKSTPRATPKAPPKADDPRVLIERYLAILDRDAGADFPLERLAQLYRQRDGNLDALAQRFEERAARGGAEGLRAKLTLAAVYAHAGDKARAEALYDEVLREAPGEELAARKLAQLLADRGDKAGARARLEPTLLSKQPDVVREQTLRSLITWSLDVSDLPGLRIASSCAPSSGAC
jgi:hypothetical protein